MTARFFVDTNVLVYAASNAAADQARRDLALELLDRWDLALSAQVLAEFYSVATSKNKLNLTHDEAVLLLRSLARIPVGPLSPCHPVPLSPCHPPSSRGLPICDCRLPIGLVRLLPSVYCLHPAIVP